MKRKKSNTIVFLLLLSLLFTHLGCGGGGGGGGGGSSDDGFSTNAIIYNPPSGDIKYSYYYYIPSSALTSRPRVVLLGHSRSRRDLPYRDLEIEVREWVSLHTPYADQYNYILLLMVVPTEAGPECVYVFPQYLKPEIFDDRFNTPECDFYYRTDLEYRKVIDEFLWLLEINGYTPYQKVFMTGFSAGGMQTNRLSFLHTDLIAAVAIGASGVFVYPVDSWNGTIMNYPWGIAGIDSLSGMYSFEQFKKIPHFIFVGASDTKKEHDPAPQDDFYLNNFGSTSASRVPIYNDYLVSIGMQSQYKMYPTGHVHTNAMKEDVFKFFESVHVQE